jgi:putative ABC transport system ATP-binding protein
MGSSGAGKSTLLYALSGMDRPTLGQVQVAGVEITKLNETRLALFRRENCGFVFQQVYLLDNMSLLDNALAAGLLVSRDRKALAARALELFGRFAVDESTARKFPAQVSGGEAQRAGMVRALINEPQALFADEPTGALDQTSGTAVLDALTEVNAAGQSIIMVTHDLKSARRGNRVIYLRDGAVCGDLDLGAYTSEGDEDRNAKLRGFLTQMGW